MEVSRPYNNEIVLIKDIVSEEENNLLIDVALQKGNAQNTGMTEREILIINKIEKIIQSVMCQEYDYMTNPSFTPMLRTAKGGDPFIIRGPGEYMSAHFDGASNRGQHEQPLNLGSIYYVNDNFEGGETFYPELGYGYKPVARSAIIHPGNPKFLHQVNEIKNGTRVTMVVFAFNDFDEVIFSGRGHI
jgi:hypothetical protein